jgi:hypothetical protein
MPLLRQVKKLQNLLCKSAGLGDNESRAVLQHTIMQPAIERRLDKPVVMTLIK